MTADEIIMIALTILTLRIAADHITADKFRTAAKGLNHAAVLLYLVLEAARLYR